MDQGMILKKWGIKKHDHNIIWISKTKIPNARAGEIAQWSGELPIVAEDEGPIFSTNGGSSQWSVFTSQGALASSMVSAYTWHLYGFYTHVNNHSYV